MPVVTRNRHGPGGPSPKDARPPETEELDLTSWESLEMTSILRWPCPYEVML